MEHFKVGEYDEFFATNMAITERKAIILNAIVDAYNLGAVYITYGDSDLGIPVKIDGASGALVDIQSMEDHQLKECTWQVCDEDGK
jgi:hypothetical protein